MLYYLEQIEGEGCHPSSTVFDDDEMSKDIICEGMELCAPKEETESLELQALREVVKELTGRKAEVYESMLQRAAGGKERVHFSAIARRWGWRQNRSRKIRKK